MRFLRQAEAIRPMGGENPSPGWSNGLPPIGSNPSSRTRREERILLIVQMSSDRLFLDRVARQQSPSPLHRHRQINTHSSHAPAKEDISTLPRGGHFYFALTGRCIQLELTLKT